LGVAVIGVGACASSFVQDDDEARDMVEAFIAEG